MMDKKALGEFREARDNWWGRLPGDAHEQGWWDALVRARDKFAEVRAAEATSTARLAEARKRAEEARAAYDDSCTAGNRAYAEWQGAVRTIAALERELTTPPQCCGECDIAHGIQDCAYQGHDGRECPYFKRRKSQGGEADG